MASFTGDKAAVLASLNEGLVAFAPRLEAKAAEVEISLKKVAKEKKRLKTTSSKSTSSTNGETKSNTKEDFRKAAADAKKKEAELGTLISEASSSTGISKKDIVRGLKSYLAKTDHDQMLKMLRAQQTLSLCFVVDATGSMHMGNIFKGVCQTIRSIIGELQASMAGMCFELSCVAYRDVCDGIRRFEVHEFDGSISGFERFLSSVRASGGGDQCEDVIGGLAKASEMTFSFANKVLFLCGDAPCHGSRFHTGCGDNYPDGRFENSRDSHEVINALRQKGIDMTFLKVNSTTDTMIEMFNQDAGSNWITTCNLDVADMEAIKDTIRSSIMESTLRSFTESKSKLDARRSSTCKNTISRLERVVEAESVVPMATTPVAVVTEGELELPIAPTLSAVERAVKKSKRERLQELKSFFEEELITKEDYDAQKSVILGE